MKLSANPLTAKPSSHSLTACLLLGTGLLFALLFRAHGTPDTDFYWLNWLELGRTLGPINAYASAGSDYPPLTMALLWLGGKLFSGITVEPILQIKLTLMVALAVSTGIYWRLSQNALLTSIFLAAHVIGVMGLVYLDIFAGLWMIGALLLLTRGTPEGFAVLFACALLTKWQPLIMAPVVALYLLSQKNIRNGAALLLLPIALLIIANVFDIRQVLQAWLKLQRAVDGTFFNAGAFGLQGFVDAVVRIVSLIGILQQPDETLALQQYQAIDAVTRIGTGPWSFARFWIFQCLFGAFVLYTLLVFLRSKRAVNDLLRCSVQMYILYFLFRHGVHENHLYTPALLALILAARQHIYLRDAVILNLLHNFNMIYCYGFDGHWPDDIWLRHPAAEAVVLLLCGLYSAWLLLLWKRWLSPAPDVYHQPAQINST